MDKVRGILDLYNEVQDEIEIATDLCEVGERQKFEDSYFKQLARAQDLLDNCNRPAPNLENRASPNVTTASSPVPTVANVRLPTIKLPEFSGKYDEWLVFSDMFTSIIHDSTEISPIQKLHYLRSCLKGDAAQVIQSIETAPDSYNVAWNLLKERYDNRRVIIQTHIRSLFELPIVTKESASGLRFLLDNTLKHMRALESLKDPIDASGSWLVHLVTAKLDKVTLREFERSINGSAVPTIDDLGAFLKNRCVSLESTSVDNADHSKQSQRAHAQVPRAQPSASSRAQTFLVKEQLPCPVCKDSHDLANCQSYLDADHRAKHDMVMRSRACLNCLRPNHMVSACKARGCRKCGRKHHVTLHFNRPIAESSDSRPLVAKPSTSDEKITTVMQVGTPPSQVLLSTAIVRVVDGMGKMQNCRVLLDCGAQSNFMTTEAVKRLKLDTKGIDVPVAGFAQSLTHLKHATEAVVKSRDDRYSSKLVFLVADSITGLIPEQPLNRKSLNIPSNITLADPQFHQPGPIDALIGAEVYYSLMSIGQIKLSNNCTLLHKTRLGWLLVGRVPNSMPTQSRCHNIIGSLDKQMREFWELEEVTNEKHLSEQEKFCEDYFLSTSRRDSNGRYHVRLPFNEKITDLGESYERAKKRFHSLELKLSRNLPLKSQYTDFLREYEQLGHMTNVTDSHDTRKGYYIPHHGIVKEDSVTTKLRVVFDASAKTTSETSLNDALRVGPVLQDDLFSLVVRFRLHSFVLTADVEKMYRQVYLHPDDTSYQKILWRSDPSKPIQIFSLNTVTYGTAPASFLATRALVQLATDEERAFPLASKIVKQDFYVDDLLTGASSIEEASNIRDELMALLNRGGFKLRKWASNKNSLLESLPEQSSDEHICLDTSNTLKTLGLNWHPQRDVIVYDVNKTVQKGESSRSLTKRAILSRIASLFDPVGLVAPVIVRAKILMQHIWLENLDWDESVTHDIATAWLEYKEQLPVLNKLDIPRATIIYEAIDIQIHGFCDASEAAYGACLYLRSADKLGKVQVRLICAKTRVAPIKKVSLPRLELCAATLLARLTTVAMQAFRTAIKLNRICLWSDSTIVLHWVNTSPHKLKTFVANRVAEIRSAVSPSAWRHVSSRDNPADLASRGIAPEQLNNSALWFTGPTWLTNSEDTWPKKGLEPIDIPEQKKTVALNVAKDFDPLEKFSSINTMKRVAAYCFRFAHNAAGNKISGSLTTKEIEHAHNKIIEMAQRSELEKERCALLVGRPIDNTSKILSLRPFIDVNGLIRVGGRIQNSTLPYSAKHPILLPSRHRVTELIIRNCHLAQLHAGVQATVYAIRQRYWIVNARSRVRKVVRLCVRCFRAAPGEVEYIMSDLPKDRVSYSRPFEISGIDYCGPFFIKEKKFRNRNQVKIYVAIFVCFTTKAIHIELVTDLTSEAFIAALRRFIARRGRARVIYSDNASTFVGARNELRDVLDLVKSEAHNRLVNAYLSNQGITWKFIPPRAPHFGGIWEAAVKSFKHHLRRVLGSTSLTFEEFYTVSVEIEAVLNSRPLTPLSTDPNDLMALSPSHFLIGDSLSNVPEHDFEDTPTNRLSNWQYTQKLKQDFWRRWHLEYLNELNQRSKWFAKTSGSHQVGSLVLLKEDNLPPLQWALGRVVEVHPGPDGVTRVATVKTKDGVFKRGVKKLISLPMDN